MSIILDALKKLDREKSSRRNRTANIAAEILKPETPPPEKRILRYFAAAVLTAVVTAAATYGVVHFSFFSKPPIPGPANAPAAGQQVALAPVSGDSVSDSRVERKLPATEIQAQGESRNPVPPTPSSDRKPAGAKPESTKIAPAPVWREPVEGSRSEPILPPSKGQERGENKTPAPPSLPPAQGFVEAKPAVEKPMPTPTLREPVRENQESKSTVLPKVQSIGEDKSSRLPSPVPVQRSTEAKMPSQQTPMPSVSRGPVPGQATKGESTAPPLLKLSGIVWSSNPEDRLAVINSQMVKEGAVIEGAKVVEIGPTSVRLMHGGKPFEISIHSLGR